MGHKRSVQCSGDMVFDFLINTDFTVQTADKIEAWLFGKNI